MEAAAAARRAVIAKERADEEARLEALIAERVAEIQRLEEVVYRALLRSTHALVIYRVAPRRGRLQQQSARQSMTHGTNGFSHRLRKPRR